MDFRMLWEKIVEFTNSQAALYVYLALLFGLFFLYRLKKRSNVKRLMADDRFSSAKLFASVISSPMAISAEGQIGIVHGAFAPPYIIHMKDINGFGMYFDGHSVAGSDNAEKSALLFKGLAALITNRMREKTKKVNLVFFMEDKSIVNVTLFSGGSRLISVIRESTQTEIKNLLSELENVEANIKQTNSLQD